jgi:hypothetical protein
VHRFPGIFLLHGVQGGCDAAMIQDDELDLVAAKEVERESPDSAI